MDDRMLRSANCSIGKSKKASISVSFSIAHKHVKLIWCYTTIYYTEVGVKYQINRVSSSTQADYRLVLYTKTSYED